MKTICIAVFLLGVGIVKSQSGLAPEVGLGLSATAYIGDLTAPSTAFNRLSPGGSLWLRLGGQGPLKPAIQIGMGNFSEQLDEGEFPVAPDVEPAEFVQTSFFFADLRLEYHFFREKNLHPYIGAGLGFLFFSPKDEAGNFLGDNTFTRLPGEYYPTTVFSFPVCLGAQIRLGKKVSTGIEYTLRPTATDYLDNLGRMGYRAGNDALHHFQLAVLFSLAPESRE